MSRYAAKLALVGGMVFFGSLQSPSDKPRGYSVAVSGTAVSMLLLIPAATLFYSRLRGIHRALALLGAVFMAFVTFFCMTTGILVWMSLASYGASQSGEPIARTLIFFVLVKLGVLGFVVFLLVAPDKWLPNLAFAEWGLCLSVAGYTYGLIRVLDRYQL